MQNPSERLSRLCQDAHSLSNDSTKSIVTDYRPLLPDKFCKKKALELRCKLSRQRNIAKSQDEIDLFVYTSNSAGVNWQLHMTMFNRVGWCTTQTHTYKTAPICMKPRKPPQCWQLQQEQQYRVDTINLLDVIKSGNFQNSHFFFLTWTLFLEY